MENLSDKQKIKVDSILKLERAQQLNQNLLNDAILQSPNSLDDFYISLQQSPPSFPLLRAIIAIMCVITTFVLVILDIEKDIVSNNPLIFLFVYITLQGLMTFSMSKGPLYNSHYYKYTIIICFCLWIPVLLYFIGYIIHLVHFHRGIDLINASVFVSLFTNILVIGPLLHNTE